jgi:hypothetical protein
LITPLSMSTLTILTRIKIIRTILNPIEQ